MTIQRINKYFLIFSIVSLILISSVVAYTYSKNDSDKLMVSYHGVTEEATPFEYLAVKALVGRDGYDIYSPADTFINLADDDLIIYHVNNEVIKVIR